MTPTRTTKPQRTMASSKPRASKTASKRAKLWSEQVGSRPHTVTVYERHDRKLAVWARWTVPGRSAPEKHPLGLTVRDSEGKLNATMTQRAAQEARAIRDRIISGEDWAGASGRSQESTGSLTLVEGVRLALDPEDGMWAAETDHTRDMRRYAEALLGALPPKTKLCEQVTRNTYETVWRRLIKQRVAAGPNEAGVIQGRRAIELTIILMMQIMKWLGDGELITKVVRPKENWQGQLAADWEKLTNQGPPPEPPRHTEVEVGLLLGAVAEERGDPRLRLAFDTGGEARLGQVRRATRKNLDLKAVGGFEAGRFTVPSRGNKKGVLIDLSPSQRDHWLRELTEGYLRDLERAYQAGRIKDYPLFPGKRLVKGVARIDVTQPLGKRAMTDMFHAFERAAGVEIVAGRAAYGVRRQATDLDEDVESDARALNAITGHTSTEMRRRYQQRENPKIIAKAAVARNRARELALAAAAAAKRDGTATNAREGVSTPSAWERNREQKLARRRRKHAAAKTGPKAAGTRPARKRGRRASATRSRGGRVRGTD